jgi:S1-C subfamily serine protease
VRSDIERGLIAAEERVTALEIRSKAAKNVIANAAPAVVFILGSFGFEDPESGKPLRLALDADGEPLRIPGGRPLVTLEGEGPLVEATYTGSAFIAATDGVLLTNRHVAMPWEKDEDAIGIQQLGLRPRHHRLIGYLPDEAQPFDLELVGVSEKFDIAVMRCADVARLRVPLTLSTSAPQAGDEVIVMGFPTGIRALLARAGESFVASLTENDASDVWVVAQELAKHKFITPLASRGIVGQVTNDAIVYDAETTQGGSGGPVLTLSGQVIAINAAIIPEFGGSNLGVPVQHAQDLMQTLEIEIPE